MSDHITPAHYTQAAAKANKGDELARAGHDTEAMAIWREILDDAERLARQKVPGAGEFVAFVHSIWNSRTGLNQSWYRLWPEEWKVEMEDRMRQLTTNPDASE
jgi:hypothetical protein